MLISDSKRRSKVFQNSRIKEAEREFGRKREVFGWQRLDFGDLTIAGDREEDGGGLVLV